MRRAFLTSLTGAAILIGFAAKLSAADQSSGGQNLPSAQRLDQRQLGLTFGHATIQGLVVSNVTSSSPLYRAGLRSSDVIVSIDSHRLLSEADFARYVYDTPNTDRLTMLAYRDGAAETIYIAPTAFYVDETYPDEFDYFGIVLDTRYPDRLIVRRVYRDAPAWDAGLRVGDVIDSFDGQRIATVAELGQAIERINGGQVRFSFTHDQRRLFAEARFEPREYDQFDGGVRIADRRDLPAGAPGRSTLK